MSAEKIVAAKILVFDSGIGGLSILQALQTTLPSCEYIYASDNQAFPYGTKSADFLLERVQKVIHALITQTQPDLLVVACNTASTLVLPHIRSQFSIPIVGVVPAIKPAALQSQSRVIGLLGTPGTVARAYTQNLISEFASDCELIKVGSSALVLLAEQALRGTPPPQAILSGILEPMFANQQLDTIILACTHFPLIKDQLVAASPRQVNWIDSGEAISRRVSSLLDKSKTAQRSQRIEQGNVIFTQRSADIGSLKTTLKNFNLGNIAYIDL